MNITYLIDDINKSSKLTVEAKVIGGSSGIDK